MASTADNSNTTTTVQLTTEGPPTVATQEDITVTLRQPETDNSNDRKVKFAQNTVDNENMNRKKSKCCCIFEKQRLFGESSSEDEDDGDCPDHCHGRKKYHKKHPGAGEHKEEENKEEKQ
ncbi:hypothetical protein TYRP_008823 [Tyrophagus putrescentiae]|nr:hypothetical protein TYRP_008823 [Tyrophagus putrescentiae]